MAACSAPLAAALLIGAGLAACQAQPRLYEPGCPAYSGDRIRIDGDRFTWERFTDVIEIGPDGQPVDPAPGFPKAGAVRRVGDELRFIRNGAEIATFSLVEADGQRYLLTAGEAAAVRAGGRIPACALTLSGSGD
jgi:hypothetical protein